jgi:integrase/recombinase XerD
LLDDFLTHLRVDRGVSSRTLVNYRLDMESYLAFMAENHLDPLTATRKELMAYLWERKDKDSSEPASLARYVASLRAFYRFLALEDKITRDPAALLTSPRKPERLPKALTVDEVSALITAVKGTKPASVRLRAMLEVMYGAGLRVSELTNLRRDQIDLRVGFVRVVGK